MKNIIIILGSYLLVFYGVYEQTISDYRTNVSTCDNWTAIYIFYKFDTTSFYNIFPHPPITDKSINITVVTNVLITYNITVNKFTVNETLDINAEDLE